jgi:hypothetical protein
MTVSCLVFLGMASSRAGSGDFAIGAGAGTMGLGVQAVGGLGDRVNLRALFNGGSISYEDSADDIDYDAEAEFSNAGLLLDWHPAGGGFRLSAGAVYNGNEISGTGRPTDITNIGGINFTPSQIGTLKARIDYPEWCGYAGIGFGNAVSRDGRWTVLFDLGVAFFGEADFSLDAEGGEFSDNPLFRRQLDKEEEDIEDDFMGLMSVYPVMTLGLSFRF